MRYDDDIELMIQQTTLIVEATSYEKLCLWQEWHTKCVWDQILTGILPTIGKLDGRPIVVSLFWARINGKMVLFYEPTSQLVDHLMIDKWFRETFPCAVGYEKEWKIDAMNFRPPLKTA